MEYTLICLTRQTLMLKIKVGVQLALQIIEVYFPFLFLTKLFRKLHIGNIIIFLLDNKICHTCQYGFIEGRAFK